MIHTNDKIIKLKVDLLNLAEELGNVSTGCKMMGLSQEGISPKVGNGRMRYSFTCVAGQPSLVIDNVRHCMKS
jgi:hypothetical protein